MRKIKLNERDLHRIVRRTINERQYLNEIDLTGHACTVDGPLGESSDCVSEGSDYGPCQGGTCGGSRVVDDRGRDKWGGNKGDDHRSGGVKTGVKGGGKYGKGGHYKDYEGGGDLNERRLTNLVRRAVNEAQLLTEESPCGFSGRGTEAERSACNECMLRGKEYNDAGGDGTDYANKVCFGGENVGGQECGEGEVMGTKGCICINPKLCGKGGERADAGRRIHDSYNRRARYRR